MLKGYVERVLKDRYVRECLEEVRQAARKVSSIVLSEHRRQASDMQTEEIQHSGEPRVLEKDGGSLRHVA